MRSIRLIKVALLKPHATFGLGLDIFTQDETLSCTLIVLRNLKLKSLKTGLDKVSPKGQEYYTKEFVNTCETEEDLIDLWNANKPDIDKLETSNPKAWEMSEIKGK